jgi:hypothetical protein
MNCFDLRHTQKELVTLLSRSRSSRAGMSSGTRVQVGEEEHRLFVGEEMVKR